MPEPPKGPLPTPPYRLLHSLRQLHPTHQLTSLSLPYHQSTFWESLESILLHGTYAYGHRPSAFLSSILKGAGGDWQKGQQVLDGRVR